MQQGVNVVSGKATSSVKSRETNRRRNHYSAINCLLFSVRCCKVFILLLKVGFFCEIVCFVISRQHNRNNINFCGFPVFVRPSSEYEKM